MIRLPQEGVKLSLCIPGLMEGCNQNLSEYPVKTGSFVFFCRKFVSQPAWGVFALNMTHSNISHIRVVLLFLFCSFIHPAQSGCCGRNQIWAHQNPRVSVSQLPAFSRKSYIPVLALQKGNLNEMLTARRDAASQTQIPGLRIAMMANTHL